MKWLSVGAAAAFCIGGGGDAQPASARSAPDAARLTPCRSSQLVIANGPPVSPATGQNPLSIVLTNRSEMPCEVKGHPTVAFFAANGERLPFRVSHRGDQMVTSRRPVGLRILPRRSAYFVLNKYRCDLGTLRVAKRIRVALPGIYASARLTLSIPTYPVIGYCGRNDPGSVVAVSPIEPTLGAALAHG